MMLASIGSAIWDFLKKLPAWVWYVVLAIVTGYVIDQRARGQQRDKDKADEQKRDGEEQARIDQVRRDQAQENTDAAQRADDTADSVPWVRARDELWDKSPGDAAILLDPVKPSGS